MLVCQLTGSLPVEAVITPDGLLFDKAAIVDYIRANNKCPITGTSLSISDLKDVKANRIVRPSIALATGDIKQCLEIINNRMNMLMEENALLIRQRDEARSQLTHCMYVNDSANQIVANQIEKIEILKNSVGPVSLKRQKVEDSTQLFSDFMSIATPLRNDLLEERRLNKFVTIPITTLEKFGKSQVSFQLPSNDGQITAMDVLLVNERGIPGVIVLGYESGLIRVVEVSTKNTITSVHLERNAVQSICCFVYPSADHFDLATLKLLTNSTSSAPTFSSPINIIAGFQNGQVAVLADKDHQVLSKISWINVKASKGVYINGETIRLDLGLVGHLDVGLGPIKRIVLHPSRLAFAVCGESNHAWKLISTATPTVIETYKLKDTAAAIYDICFQPDGLLMTGCSDENEVIVWDIATTSVMSKLPSNTPLGSYTCCAFSNIGFLLLCGTVSGQLVFWDLRKLAISQILNLAEPIVSISIGSSGKVICAVSAKTMFIISIVHKKVFGIVTSIELSKPSVSIPRWNPVDESFIALVDADCRFNLYCEVA